MLIQYLDLSIVSGAWLVECDAFRKPNTRYSELLSIGSILYFSGR